MSAKPRCPKHGTILIEAAGDDDPDPWCWPCWNLDRQRQPGPDIEGACIAMSRVLVWAYLEAEYSSEWSPGVSRPELVVGAIEAGLLRLDWSRP